MPLTEKERQRIIDEETLRHETRQALAKRTQASRQVIWPWILAGAALVWLAWGWAFCPPSSCMHGSAQGCMHGQNKSSIHEQHSTSTHKALGTPAPSKRADRP